MTLRTSRIIILPNNAFRIKNFLTQILLYVNQYNNCTLNQENVLKAFRACQVIILQINLFQIKNTFNQFILFINSQYLHRELAKKNCFSNSSSLFLKTVFQNNFFTHRLEPRRFRRDMYRCTKKKWNERPSPYLLLFFHVFIWTM